MPEHKPDLYELAWRKALYPFYETTLRGRGTFRYLAEYQANERKSRDELEAIQWAKVQALLRFCGEQVPYYQERWKAERIDWRDVKSMADFERLPVLTKDDIRRHYESFIAPSQRGRTMRKTTGGSTGKPFAFEYTRESYERRTAVTMRGYAWAGSRPGRRSAFVWGSDIAPPPRLAKLKVDLHHWLLRRRVFNAFQITRDNIDEYLRAIDRFRPHVIVGYVAPLHLLARRRLELGPPAWRPEGIIAAAERLHEFQREDIQRAFEGPVFNTYGCREFMLMASECERRDGLHANIDHLVVETLDAARRPAASGEITITDLHNYGMPFIRYQNGDLASWKAGECTCGRHMPRLAAIEGRVLDVLRTPDGRTVPGEFFPHMMKDVRGVGRFQVVQRRLDEIVVNIVKEPGFDDASIAFMSECIRGTFGDSVRVRYEFPKEIALTATGKQRVTISQLENAA